VALCTCCEKCWRSCLLVWWRRSHQVVCLPGTNPWVQVGAVDQARADTDAEAVRVLERLAEVERQERARLLEIDPEQLGVATDKAAEHPREWAKTPHSCLSTGC
jgi:hypothetical protein